MMGSSILDTERPVARERTLAGVTVAVAERWIGGTHQSTCIVPYRIARFRVDRSREEPVVLSISAAPSILKDGLSLIRHMCEDGPEFLSA